MLMPRHFLPGPRALQGLLLAALSLARADAAEPVRYNRDIRPILSENCFSCHGPDANHRKAGLRLDVRAEALKAAESEKLPSRPGPSASRRCGSG